MRKQDKSKKLSTKGTEVLIAFPSRRTIIESCQASPRITRRAMVRLDALSMRGEKQSGKIQDDVIGRKLEEFKSEWALKTQQIDEIIQASKSSANFPLDTVTVSLGFTAKGKLAFLAEAGLQGTITLTYKKAQPTTKG